MSVYVVTASVLRLGGHQGDGLAAELAGEFGVTGHQHEHSALVASFALNDVLPGEARPRAVVRAVAGPIQSPHGVPLEFPCLIQSQDMAAIRGDGAPACQCSEDRLFANGVVDRLA